ncbi:MAG: hypothetical protein QOH15_2965 [Gaiellales bacterium]|jgi:hypothetical protein|nr:hypothetical protein [Gaiellales bacterium]
MEERARRVVENEAKFRLVNEAIQAVVRRDKAQFGEPIEEISIICECGVNDCTETIGLPLSVYEWTRAESTRFVVASGHHLPEYERVMRDGDGYAVVEKLGEARGAASDLDPNAR